MKSVRFIISSAIVICTMLAFSSRSVGQTVYHFADGNGNLYTLNNKHLAYDPVTPETSSTGEYSGGEATIKKISDDETAEILNAFTAAIDNEENHVEKRVKGSGWIRVENTSEDVDIKFNLRRGSDEMVALQGLLEKAIK